MYIVAIRARCDCLSESLSLISTFDNPGNNIYNIWEGESSNRTKRHLGKNELGPDSYVSDNSHSFGPY